MASNYWQRLPSLNIFNQLGGLSGRMKSAQDIQVTLAPETKSARFKPASEVALISLLTLLPLWGCTTTKLADNPPIILYQQIDVAADPVFREAVEEARAAGWPPYTSTLDPAAAAKADFRVALDFQIHDKDLMDAERIWQMTTLMMLTFYPSSCARYNFELTADLYERSGRRLKSWRLDEQDTAFLWFFQGDECMDPADSTVRKIAKSMLKDLYRRMAEDETLAGLTADSASDLPLVHISARNAQDLVEQVAKTDAPFSNFAFAPPTETAVNYTLTVEFDSVRQEQSLSALLARGMASIPTIGLVSFCPAYETILSAEIHDAEGTVLRQYSFAETKRGSGIDNCPPVTYATDPELAERLLLQLFRQIGRDGVIPGTRDFRDEPGQQPASYAGT